MLVEGNCGSREGNHDTNRMSQQQTGERTLQAMELCHIRWKNETLARGNLRMTMHHARKDKVR